MVGVYDQLDAVTECVPWTKCSSDRVIVVEDDDMQWR